MKTPHPIFLVLVVIIVSGLVISFIVNTNIITKRNIELRIPKDFPFPIYTFNNNKLTPEIVMLGRQLFYDPILSKDSTISCASCHKQMAAFATKGQRFSNGIDNRTGFRNVPAIQNLIWKDEFMWDGGVNHIEVQPLAPITNKDEMNETIVNVLNKLNRNKQYKAAFGKAFGDTIITSVAFLKSLAQFTGIMISANSKFDSYIKKKINFNESETRGLALFTEKCNNCHTAPLFTNNQFANNGLTVDSKLNDLGRGRITGSKKDNYTFKIPSLRNVEVTFPYMHDGRINTLTSVLKHYSDLAKDTTITDNKLKKIGTLSDSEKNDIIEFLKTLTDKSFLFDKRFSFNRK